MPLIALDILDNKIKELLVIINHLSDENAALKSRLNETRPQASSPSANNAAVAIKPELLYELENLKKTVIRYKNDRNQLYTKLAGVLRQVDGLINRE
jgi:cell division septum initiation protein DivIVA